MTNKMPSKMSPVGRVMLTVVLAAAALFSQTTPLTASLAGIEFPVIMRQNVAAGKTPVGAKVQAKLSVATLVNGKVVPQDAILSGEVIESAAKSATDPSRLAIRMDSAQWKNGSTPLKVYLTAWYYPLATQTAQEHSDDQTAALHRSIRWSGSGAHSDSKAQVSQPFPDSDTDSDKDRTPPPPPQSSISKHRVLMKDVEFSRSNKGGAVTLTSKRFNIKLDRSTTYVLAAGALGAGPS